MNLFRRQSVGHSGQGIVEVMLLVGLVLPFTVMGLQQLAGSISGTSEPMLAAAGLFEDPFAASFAAQWSLSESSPVSGNVYYVDSVGGTDSNPGTSEGAPWKSVAKVNAAALAPGDSVLFKAGRVWRETLVLSYSGTAGAPITFGSYGQGSRPILTGSRAPDEDGCQWKRSSGGTNEYYLVKSGGSPGYRKPGDDVGDRPGWLWYRSGPTKLLKGTAGSLADGQWGWGDRDGLGFSTIYVRCDAGTPGPIEVPQSTEGILRISGKSYIVVSNLSFRFANLMPGAFVSDGAHHITFQDCEFAYNLQTGLQIWGCQSSHHDSYTTVRRCVAHDNGGHGIAADGLDRRPVCKLRQVTFEDCEAYGQVRSYFGDVDGYGIVFTFVDNSTIRRCKSHNNELTGIHMDGNTGAALEYLDGCQHNDIDSNVVYGNGGAGIEAEVSSNNTIHGNMIYDNGTGWAGNGICINNYATGNYLHHNLITGTIGGPAINIFGGSSGTQLVHNTVSVGGTSALHIEDSSSTPGTKVFNNILHSKSLCFTFATVDGLTSDYNCVGGVGKRFGEPWPTYSLAAWRQLSGQDMHSIDATDVFVDPNQKDYTLRAGSPCIDAGTDKNFPYEGATPDIGAFEYDTPAPPAGQWALHVQSTPITGVSIASSAAGGATNYSATLKDGSQVSLTAPATYSVGDTDYDFVRWALNGANRTAGQRSLSFNITADTTAVAVYQIQQHTLNVQSAPVTGVTVTDGAPRQTNYTIEVDDNKAVNITAPATHSANGTDYQFVRWTLNGASQPAGKTTLSFRINADSTAVASYEPIIDEPGPTWTIWVESTPVRGVPITGNPAGNTNLRAEVREDSLVSLTAPATFSQGGSNYAFVRWMHNGANRPEGETTLSFRMVEDSAEVAVYELSDTLPVSGWTVNVRSTPITRVSVSGNPAGSTDYSGEVKDGGTVSLTAPATHSVGGTDYEFVRWTLNSANQSAGQRTLSFTIKGDATAVAVYKTTRHTLSVRSTPVSGVAITSNPAGTTDYSAELDDNSSVSLKAPATHSGGGTDYEFVRWTLNGTDQPAGQATLTFSINGDATAIAVYKSVEPTCKIWVESTPIRGVSITGDADGVTDYSDELPENTLVSLTAPATFTSGGKTYSFVRWVHNGVNQVNGKRTLEFRITEDTAEVAVYQ